MIQEQVYAALSPLVSGRVYPSVAPNNVTAPYIVYFRVASTPENTLADGQPIQQTRLQVDVYDKTYLGPQTLAEQAKPALTAPPVKAIQILAHAPYAPAVRLHRVIHDYSFLPY